MRRSKLIGDVLCFVLLTAGGSTMLLPLLWMVSTSLKEPGAVMSYPPEFVPRKQETWVEPETGRELPVFWAQIEGKQMKVARIRLARGKVYVRVLTAGELAGKELSLPLYVEESGRRRPTLRPVKHVHFRWRNYSDAWHAMKLERPWMAFQMGPLRFAGIRIRDAFTAFYLNSVLVSVVVTLGCVTTSSLAGYAFARLWFPGRDTLFLTYLGSLMVPHVVTMIPVFILLRFLGLIDSYWAMILPGMFSAYGTFMLRQFFLSVPRDVEDAARIDGCGMWGVYWHVIMPLSRPALAALGTFVFLWTWNSFMWPLIVMNSTEKMPLMVGLYTFIGPYSADWQLLMAASVMVMGPVIVVFLLGQRYFVEGMMLTGLKG
jgi:multiple sugar transport system permease protein